ncbi:glycoside hydrolase family 3 C-terminal domain-containing protein [Actinotalea sp. M2MS4P-6]|uniref:beta-glucosidase family protein n=1 Tax=Actinotalea sp. M2MS4P-6 TaxID=2983762 RepID=UPI0021E39055|nr:glycoside hydrolase family 3 C-terminal domain-containing protein [Actinotalea sp. M2MS4P-6]MCV2394445.1 glycoside hydrolase family 3 C-terminal domain-containing protein [Actinotalea sp. M2MS4P-6]
MTTQPTAAPAAAPAVDEADLRRRLAALDLPRKVRLLTGADFWSLYPEPAAGLRRLVVSDGPAGVRGELWDDRDPSANVPSPTSLAATWDPDRVEQVGVLLAAEARRKGVDVLLAPTVNLHRTPYGGRHFECYSEDPLLTARIGAAYVTGVQSGGVGACVKHFVANDSETERMSLDAIVDERVLRELYLVPFDTIVREAGAWSVMAAYNRVNGTFMTANDLLRDVLQDEWGFDGLTMSDWFAARSTVESATGGLDLVMPGPAGPWGDALLAAVRAGEVDEARIDDHVLRLLRLAARVGALDGIPGFAEAAPVDDAAVDAQVRSDAAAGMVLVANDGLLPLVGPGGASPASVAVLGPNSEVSRTLGGGSATVFPRHTVSPLAGIARALPGATITHAPGVRPYGRFSVSREEVTQRPDGTPGLLVRFLAADGAELGREERRGGAFNWMAGIPADGEVATVEVSFAVVADRAGTHHVGGSGLGDFEVTVGDSAPVSEHLELAAGRDLVEALMAPPQHVVPVDLGIGESVAVVVRHRVGSGPTMDGVDIGTMMHVNVELPMSSDDDEIERAVALAAEAEVAVVVVGTTEEVESEGYDRTTLALPGRQDELVSRVAAANPRTVVVVNSGAPVLTPWVDEVAAVVLAWFPGQEFGDALADVLLGTVEPGGRLPVSWPANEANLPSATPVDGVLRYDEGLRIGYRNPDRAMQFPFGHGLGYTTWSVDELAVTGGGVEVTVTNTGARPGRQVVQVYASRPDSAVERPHRWLVGFAAVVAEPGEQRSVPVAFAPRAFQHWDVAAHAWVTEPGTFVVAAGASATDLPVVGEVTV